MATANAGKQNRLVIFLMAVVLGFGLFTALAIPAGEFPSSGYAIFSMSLDAVMTVILAVLLFAERGAEASGVKTVAMLVGSAGVLAGAAQVLIRFTSDHAWWTGHYLPPVFN
ncbi:hypothetical protein [Tabrizicola sp.]|uniref:hypothetical protein n=1 Tax=Tabrizicola sp. TaxID=2005166 RepID=UPI00286B3564|nr:hypothetical protein [Tabrizicola sp.]